MLNVDHFRHYVVRPTLEYLAPDIPYSVAAENLLVATAVHESKLTYLVQHGDGPARGLFQIEPTTERDNWDNFLRYKKSLRDKVESLSAVRFLDLAGNLPYQVAHARIKYLRDKEPLPGANDIIKQAAYWKRVYNTHLGKGSEVQFIKNYPEEILL